MIKSMTGHGCIEKTFDYGTVSVEMRSVNSRYFDVSIKNPDFLELYKNDLSKILAKKLHRGRVTVFIKYEPNGQENIAINFDAAEKIYQDMLSLKRRLKLTESVNLQHLLTIPEVLQEQDPEVDMELMVSDIKTMLSEAADKMNEMRAAEGKNLEKVIGDKLTIIHEDLSVIKEKIDDRKASYFEKFKELVQELAADINIEEDRLLQEVAIMTKKVDISEECDRIDSHISLFNQYLAGDHAVGKKMNFLVQELNREMTTIGSKSESAEISQRVVNMKNELEKIREQVQNIL